MKGIINVGDTAPLIHTSDLWGNEISIPANGKWVYLSFHRFAACPFCNLRTNELIRNYERFAKLNIDIISIWPSAKDSLLRYAGREKSPLPILSDPGKRRPMGLQNPHLWELLDSCFIRNSYLMP